MNLRDMALDAAGGPLSQEQEAEIAALQREWDAVVDRIAEVHGGIFGEWVDHGEPCT